MKNKIKNINKDFLKRNVNIKKELKKLVLRSIIQNLNIKPNIRALAIKKLAKISLNHSISKQNNNLCLLSGRYKGVLKLTQITRHEIKKKAIKGSLQNIKTAA